MEWKLIEIKVYNPTKCNGGDNNITNQPLRIPQKCNGYENA